MTVELLEKIIVKNLCPIRNLIIDGPAGSGKSTLIRKVKKRLGSKCVVTAVTGIASKLIDGRTISSICRLKLYDLEDHEIKEENACNDTLADADILIIDEVSMQKPEELRQVDLACKSAKNNFQQPFGGMRLILFGDSAQLKPITVYPKQGIVETNDNVYDAFKKGNLASYNFHLVHFNKIFRQKDELSKNVLYEKIRPMIINKDYTKIGKIQTFLKELLNENENQEGINLYSNSRALPEENVEVDSFYFPKHKKERAPYEQLPLVEDGMYLVTRSFQDVFSDNHVNGEVIRLNFISNIDDYEISAHSREKITVKKEIKDENGNVIDIISKKKTVDGDLLYSYAPLMLLTDATTRRVQGSTFEKGNIAPEFFSLCNRVRLSSIDGWLRVLYVALSRFESLHSVSFVETNEKNEITSDYRVFKNDKYQIKFNNEYGEYSFKIVKNNEVDELLTKKIRNLCVSKTILNEDHIPNAINGLFDKIEAVILNKEFYSTMSPRGDYRIKTENEWAAVADREGWQLIKKGDLSNLLMNEKLVH